MYVESAFAFKPAAITQTADESQPSTARRSGRPTNTPCRRTSAQGEELLVLTPKGGCLFRFPQGAPTSRSLESGFESLVRSREAALPPGQIVGGHFPSTYVASESPGQGGMETQMNVRSASPVFRY